MFTFIHVCALVNAPCECKFFQSQTKHKCCFSGFVARFMPLLMARQCAHMLTLKLTQFPLHRRFPAGKHTRPLLPFNNLSPQEYIELCSLHGTVGTSDMPTHHVTSIYYE